MVLRTWLPPLGWEICLQECGRGEMAQKDGSEGCEGLGVGFDALCDNVLVTPWVPTAPSLLGYPVADLLLLSLGSCSTSELLSSSFQRAEFPGCSQPCALSVQHLDSSCGKGLLLLP